MENQLAHAITQTEYDLSYDKAAKKLLANKQILAQIMKNCVNEYSACSVDEIAEKYIEGTPEVGTVGVHVDDTNRPKKTSDVIAGSNNEDSTLTEGTINYDVRFDAIAPASEGSAEQKDVIRLIINVEAQTAFNPGYPLTKRAIYYCSRMISAQHGPVFTNSEYGKIRKVYSIWVCTHPTKEFQNTLIRYSIRPEQLIGNAVEKSENYDLMSVVTICLGEPGTENYTGIVKFMDVLLSSSRAATEKKKILEEEFGVAMNEDLEREVLVMCNLSQGVKAEGISIGEMRMLVQLVRDGDLKIERAAEKANMTVEQFKKVMDVMEGAIPMSGGILDGFQTIIPTAAAVLSERRQMLRMTQQKVADRANITLRQYQRLESGERNILTSSFGLACRVIEALDMDVSKFYHGDYCLEEEVKTMRGKGIASRKKSSI